jgi:hypothetical protein
LLLLLLGSRAFRVCGGGARTAAPAPSASAPRCLLQLACGRRLRFLLRRARLLLRTLWLLRTRSASALLLLLLLRAALLLLLRTLAVARTLLLPLAIASSALVALALTLAGPAATIILASHLAGALLELADLLLHEPPRLLVEAVAQLVVTAVRAALPPFGIGLFAT